MSSSSFFEQHQAVIIDRGPAGYEWVKARLANGDECFLYSDTEQTVKPKSLPIATILNVQQPRQCTNPGPTKWTTNALALEMQSDEFKDQQSFSADRLMPVHPVKQEKRKAQLTARYSVSRERKINEIISAHGMSGKYATADAVAHAIDLCIANNLV
jgi:hypothetical protein